MTNSAGNVTIHQICKGTYNFVVQSDDNLSQHFNVTFNCGEVHSANVVLIPPPPPLCCDNSFELFLVDANGDPYINGIDNNGDTLGLVYVTLYKAGYDNIATETQATDHNGRVFFKNICKGEATFVISIISGGCKYYARDEVVVTFDCKEHVTHTLVIECE